MRGMKCQGALCGKGFQGQAERSRLEGEVRGWEKPGGQP